ncbi:MAG: hypothetical protein ACREO1_09615 [Arenimonas sp.]
MNTDFKQSSNKAMQARFVVIFAAAVLFGVAILSILDVVKYMPLLTSTATTEATITRLNCSSHATYYYVFSVNGKSFESSSNHPAFGKDCGQRLGEKFVVTYLPEDPSINTPGSPEKLIEIKKSGAISRSIVFIVLLIVIALMVAYSRIKASLDN